VFRDFVTGFGLEFYPLGGDPAVLSEFVVKNRGIMPGLNVVEALKQREQASQFPSCLPVHPCSHRPDQSLTQK